MRGRIVHQNAQQDRIGNGLLISQQAEQSPEQIMHQINNMAYKPLISIILETDQPSCEWMKRTIVSIQQQYYPNWELCIVQGTREKYRRCLHMARRDGRIKVLMNRQGQHQDTWNKSLALCAGEYTAIIREGDELTKDALFWVAKAISEERDIDFLYSDECRLKNANEYEGSDFALKPDWSLALLLNYMYTGHLAVYRTASIRQAGGFRSDYQIAQEYDLLLRLSHHIGKVRHIERILYYERIGDGLKPSVDEERASQEEAQAVKEWYQRKGFEVLVTHAYGGNEVQILNKRNEKVSIIIPSDSLVNLRSVIDGIINNTQYSNIEIIAVTNSRLIRRLGHRYIRYGFVRFHPYDKPFNFSDKCNEGAIVATGERLVFFNDDAIPKKRDWIERLLDVAYLPWVGAVSPMLLYENQTIQYAGMFGGSPALLTGTAFYGIKVDEPVTNRIHHMLVREVGILSGACTMMAKDIFMKIGMFDAVNTPNGHSDVDLAFRLRENKYECVYTPYSVIIHKGSNTWEAKSHADKADIFCLKRWGPYLERDQYFTDSMKRLFERYYPDFYKIYEPRQIKLGDQGGKDILFVIHELSRTGAPVVVQEFVKMALKKGHFPVVLTYDDGPLRQEYYEMGVTVIIDKGSQYRKDYFEHFARNFDLVVVSTLVCSNSVELLANSLPKVIWWIHEGIYGLNHIGNLLPKRYGSNISIYCGGEYSKEIVQTKIPGEIKILNYGVEDAGRGVPKLRVENGLTFVIPATYEVRKGQDLMANAIRLLSEEEKKKIHFIFMGRVVDPRVLEQVQNLASTCANVQIINPVSRTELFALYDRCTGVIMPSRDDPMPVVLTEAMMKYRICICSTNTGTSRYIQSGHNGFVFQTEDYTQLANILKYIIQNPDVLPGIAENGRKVYERYFSYPVFESNISRIIDSV
ncbi:MAG: glycosyltransferase [Lachnospiraceae bacterium]|nr:glycosyltransferase [Lachnospiraceae bacterium]